MSPVRFILEPQFERVWQGENPSPATFDPEKGYFPLYHQWRTYNAEESLIVVRYALETQYLPSSKFAQTGFQGKILYEMKGLQSSPEARWLTPLARFALFSGVGYKTSMGMGQTRCTNLGKVHNTNDNI